jgi:hypothetical protein
MLALAGVIAPTKLPLPSYGLFAVRDCMTIAASFTLPKKISAYMQERSAVSPRMSGRGFAMLWIVLALQRIESPYGAMH